jgi:tetratricopeptide (TPR) repeat protein
LSIWVENALTRNPSDSNALYVKAVLLCRVGQYPDALSLINQVLAHHPNDPWCVLAKGDIFFSLKDFSEAIHWYQKILNQCS